VVVAVILTKHQKKFSSCVKFHFKDKNKPNFMAHEWQEILILRGWPPK
jgi:hypothetical protein